jgi:hypothetical protein
VGEARGRRIIIAVDRVATTLAAPDEDAHVAQVHQQREIA